MSITNRWWNNESFLRAEGIQSQYVAYSDQMQFRKSWDMYDYANSPQLMNNQSAAFSAQQGYAFQALQNSSYNTGSQQQSANVVVDQDALHQGHFTYEDLQKHFEDQRKSAPGYVHPGPTNKDLEHPAVRNAWEEYLVIYRLSLGK